MAEVSSRCANLFLCCSQILATEAILCSAISARDQTSELKAKGTGSISGRVTLGGTPAEGIPVVAVSGQTQLIGAMLPRDLPPTVKAGIVFLNCYRVNIRYGQLRQV